MLISGILTYYFLSITPIADLIIFPLENEYSPPYFIINNEYKLSESLKAVDTIVLLNGEFKRAELTFISKFGEGILFRAVEAAQIYKNIVGQNPKIIVSGTSAIDSDSNIAYLVGKFLENIGIPQNNIILEEKSRTTYESAKEIKEILGNKPFLLITSAYHMPRSIFIFRKFGLNPIPAPVDYKAELWGQYSIFDFFPRPKNLEKTNLAFHEYFGLIFYRLRTSLGI